MTPDDIQVAQTQLAHLNGRSDQLRLRRDALDGELAAARTQLATIEQMAIAAVQKAEDAVTAAQQALMQVQAAHRAKVKAARDGIRELLEQREEVVEARQRVKEDYGDLYERTGVALRLAARVSEPKARPEPETR
jgi:chromosome segregation ATPase